MLTLSPCHGNYNMSHCFDRKNKSSEVVMDLASQRSQMQFGCNTYTFAAILTRTHDP